MGNSCGTKSTTVTEVVNAGPAKGKPKTVPYIVVSSVSLSRKIADENMCASVTNSPRAPQAQTSTSHKRRPKYRRKRSSVSPSADPLKASTDTIVFQDQMHKHRMEVEIVSSDAVPYLTLQSSGSDTLEPPSPSSISRVSSLASLADTTDDVSLTSALLKPEDKRRAERQTKGCERSNSQLSLHNYSRHQSRRFSDGNKKGQSVKQDEDDKETDCWETSSMKQQLQKARSISAIDLLQMFKESGVLDKEFSDDNDVWKWFDTDSGRSSPVEDVTVDGASSEELIMAKLDLLSLYAPMKGPTMKSRVSAIANEIVVLYEKLTNRRLHVERSVKELISSVDAIRSYKDIHHYVSYSR